MVKRQEHLLAFSAALASDLAVAILGEGLAARSSKARNGGLASAGTTARLQSVTAQFAGIERRLRQLVMAARAASRARRDGAGEISGAIFEGLTAPRPRRSPANARMTRPGFSALSPRALQPLAGAIHEWCRGPESNRRHYDFQSYALPTELPRRVALSNLAKRGDDLPSRALPLSYLGLDDNAVTLASRGGRNRTRTCDLLGVSEAL